MGTAGFDSSLEQTTNRYHWTLCLGLTPVPIVQSCTCKPHNCTTIRLTLSQTRLAIATPSAIAPHCNAIALPHRRSQVTCEPVSFETVCLATTLHCHSFGLDICDGRPPLLRWLRQGTTVALHVLPRRRIYNLPIVCELLLVNGLAFSRSILPDRLQTMLPLTISPTNTF